MSYIELTEVPTYVVPQNEADRLNTSTVKWSGGEAPPKIGAKVHVLINGIGRATVTGYFVEHGWLGILARPAKAPAWYVTQNGRYHVGHFFGIEIGSIAPKEPCAAVQNGMSKCNADHKRRGVACLVCVPEKATRRRMSIVEEIAELHHAAQGVKS